MNSYALDVVVTRGDLVESCHRVHAAVVDRDGRLRWSVHNANPDGRDLDEHLRELHAAVDQHLV